MNTSEFTPRQLSAIRISVAELAGWTRVHPDAVPDRVWPCRTYVTGDQTDAMFPPPGIGTGKVASIPPDYPQSLDAIMGVVRSERYKDQFFFFDYTQRLKVVVHPESEHFANIASLEGFELITATATDHCIALLQVKAPDKWEKIKANP